MAYGTPALAALVVVAIYEGKAYLATAPENGGRASGDTRPAGNAHPSDDREIGQAGLTLAAAGELPKSSAPGAASKGGQIASQLDNVKGKLAAVQREKRDLEVQLRTLEKELEQRAVSPPGGKADEFDLNREDWKELAAQGRIKYRIPCMLPPESAYAFPQDELDELGLSPDDGPLLTEARRRSNARVWGSVRPLCLEAVGDPEVVDLLGTSNCLRLIEKVAMKGDLMAAADARRQVAEVHAGMRPPPEAGQVQHPVFDAYMAVTGEAQRFEADLAENFGPEEAKRIARSMRCVATVR